MKRVMAAYLQQTLHFYMNEDVDREYAARLVQEEVAQYKAKLERSGIVYKILSEKEESDGSVIMNIKRQYNAATEVGDYFD